MKLAIIGGASAYTPDILDGLLRQWKVFAGWEMLLHDIDINHLQIIERLARAMVRAVGADWIVKATTDRAEAIAGARFILAQPRVGGLAARTYDERIPLTHGLVGQETLGVGGLSFAWRTIPLMLELIAETNRLSPEAWIINYANPVGMVTEAVLQQYPRARFIGLCDMPAGLQWAVSKLLRVDARRLSLEYGGLNHGGWCHRVLLDGSDIAPRLHRFVRLLGPLTSLLPLTEQTGTLRLFQTYGLLPDPYLRYYYDTERMLKQLRRQRQTRAEVLVRRIARLYSHYGAVSAAERPVLRMHRGHSAHSDLASQVIATMAAGRRAQFVIQQRNGGAVPDLPPEEAAQFPAWVGSQGWEPIPVPSLPGALPGLLQQIKRSESLNVAAALRGDRALAVAAAAENPLVPNRRVAEVVVDQLLAAHRAYLPQFYH